ncbi:MAG TPA: tetratricopeptide repeat-containing protein kinase family protein, partial [Candidatus Obscuribacterales bacterium]
PPLVGNNLLETLFKHVNEAPSSFATACPDKAVPEKLEAIVFKSLHKDPEHRYQSMRDLKKDLEAFFDSIEPGWISKARLKFELVRLKVVPLVAREKKILAFGLAVTVVLIIVAAQLLNVYFADVNEPPPGPGIAWAVTQPAPQSQQIDFEQNLAMAQKVMAGIQKLEGTKSSRYIHALGKLALFYEKNGHYGEATEAYKQAYTLSRDMEGIRSWSTKEAMIAYADALMKGGEFAKAEEQYQLLIQQLQLESPNPEPHIYLHALQHLGDAQMLLQRYGEAIVSYETALKNIDRRKDSHSGQTTYAAMLSRLADCYRISGQYSRAQPVYARAYDCWKNLLKRDEAAPVLLSRRFIGYCHWQLGQYKRARGCYESVLPLMEKTLGAANQTTLSAMREYSQLMWDKGNYWHSVVTHWRIQECRAKKGSTG